VVRSLCSFAPNTSATDTPATIEPAMLGPTPTATPY
jgi:hypothetical protein